MTAEAPEGTDRFGKIETHGIDHIPDGERHGRPAELLPVWLSSNIAYIYILVGGTLTVLGLSVWQAVAVLLAGNLFWLLVGFAAISGPAAGAPSGVITRAMYGIRGNRLLGAGLTWLVCVVYEGINLAIGALAGFALVEFCGIPASLPVKIAVALLIGLATFAISVYGHATIVRLSGAFTLALGAAVVLLGVFVAGHATAHPAGFAPLHGGALWATALIGFTIIASLPLSWGNGADYSRYLPAGSSRLRVAGWTALGGGIPSVVLGLIGILAGTAVDMTDPQTSMRALVPGWFYAVFLALLVLGSVTNNVLTAYSSGLALQALGLRVSRVRSVVIDAVLGGALCAYALASADFLDTMNNLLALTVTFLGPGLAIYAADIVLRRNVYPAAALHDERPGSPYWYRGGVNWAGAIALLLGTLAAVAAVDTTVFAGPLANALGGADLSSIVGPLVAAAVYITATKAGTEAAGRTEAAGKTEAAVGGKAEGGGLR